MRYVIAFCVLLYGAQVKSVEASTISDNFDDGIADGWISALPSPGYGHGNWQVVNGQIIQNQGGDNYKFLLNDLQLTSQTIEADLLHFNNGYEGLTVWYKDTQNWVDVVGYPAGLGGWGPLAVIESVQGQYTLTSLSPYAWWTNGNGEGVWSHMEVAANSDTGILDISINDIHAATYQTQSIYRYGLSGLNSGNGGGAFDNFQVTFTDISTIPEPSTILLLLTALPVLYILRRSLR